MSASGGEAKFTVLEDGRRKYELLSATLKGQKARAINLDSTAIYSDPNFLLIKEEWECLLIGVQKINDALQREYQANQSAPDLADSVRKLLQQLNKRYYASRIQFSAEVVRKVFHNKLTIHLTYTPPAPEDTQEVIFSPRQGMLARARLERSFSDLRHEPHHHHRGHGGDSLGRFRGSPTTHESAKVEQPILVWQGSGGSMTTSSAHSQQVLVASSHMHPGGGQASGMGMAPLPVMASGPMPPLMLSDFPGFPGPGQAGGVDVGSADEVARYDNITMKGQAGRTMSDGVPRGSGALSPTDPNFYHHQRGAQDPIYSNASAADMSRRINSLPLGDQQRPGMRSPTVVTVSSAAGLMPPPPPSSSSSSSGGGGPEYSNVPPPAQIAAMAAAAQQYVPTGLGSWNTKIALEYVEQGTVRIWFRTARGFGPSGCKEFLCLGHHRL